jgi:hypothetical protein
MTITLFGATGLVGHQLMVHCFAKGWQVTAFGRNVENLIDADLRNEQLTVMKGYVFDESDVQKALKDADAVLSALGGASNGADKARSIGMARICGQMKKAGIKRIVALGGLGVLPDETGNLLLEKPDYPQAYVAVGREHLAAYQHLKASGLDWTFVCAPNIVNKDADGMFETVAEGAASNQEISAGNLALFMTDSLEKGTYIQQRVGIGQRR